MQVLPHGSLQVERVFSAHNLVKNKLRTDLGMEASAAQVRACNCFCIGTHLRPSAYKFKIWSCAQTRICMMRKKLGPFGGEKMEAFVDKVYEAMKEKKVTDGELTDGKMWPRFKVDMTKRDALDERIKTERAQAVAQARGSIEQEMEPEIRSQVRAEVATEVCLHFHATCVGESCPSTEPTGWCQ